MLRFKNYIHERRTKKYLAKSLYEMIKIQNVYFDSYLKEDFLSKKYVYARILHKRTMSFFRAIQHARELIQKDLNYTVMLSKIECLYEVICSTHLLRYRVNEYSVFEICARELRGLEKTSSELLTHLAKSFFEKNVIVKIDDYLDAIHSFETIYNHTLQVVVRDPVVFLFFIQDLYALQELMVKSDEW